MNCNRFYMDTKNSKNPNPKTASSDALTVAACSSVSSEASMSATATNVSALSDLPETIPEIAVGKRKNKWKRRRTLASAEARKALADSNKPFPATEEVTPGPSAAPNAVPISNAVNTLFAVAPVAIAPADNCPQPRKGKPRGTRAGKLVALRQATAQWNMPDDHDSFTPKYAAKRQKTEEPIEAEMYAHDSFPEISVGNGISKNKGKRTGKKLRRFLSRAPWRQAHREAVKKARQARLARTVSKMTARVEATQAREAKVARVEARKAALAEAKQAKEAMANGNRPLPVTDEVTPGPSAAPTKPSASLAAFTTTEQSKPNPVEENCTVIATKTPAKTAKEIRRRLNRRIKQKQRRHLGKPQCGALMGGSGELLTKVEPDQLPSTVEPNRYMEGRRLSKADRLPINGEARALLKRELILRNTTSSSERLKRQKFATPPAEPRSYSDAEIPGIVLGITNQRDYLGRRQYAEVSNILHTKLLEAACTYRDCGPEFLRKPLYARGNVKLYCLNQNSKDWVKRTLENFKLKSGDVIFVKDQTDIVKRVRCSLLVPGIWLDGRKVGRLIRYQNTWADVDRWLMYKSEIQEDNTFIVVGIPENILPTLEEMGHKLSFSLGSIYVQVRVESISECPAVKDTGEKPAVPSTETATQPAESSTIKAEREPQ